MSMISFLSPFCSYMFHAGWNSTETRYGACRRFKWEIIVDKKKKWNKTTCLWNWGAITYVEIFSQKESKENAEEFSIASAQKSKTGRRLHSVPSPPLLLNPLLEWILKEIGTYSIFVSVRGSSESRSCSSSLKLTFHFLFNPIWCFRSI